MKLSYKKTILVGFAFFLICAFWQAYDTIVPKILTDKFGMSQSWSGIVMGLDNIIALFMLPLFGTLSDKCRSRFGRRTPFILFGTIVAALALVGLGYVDNLQRQELTPVIAATESGDYTAALGRLYDADLTVTTPGGETVRIQEKFTRAQYTSIPQEKEDGKVNPEYTDYVVTARQAWAWRETWANKGNLILFMAVLLVVLLAMATFRSPAVALMPDVTIKPLRSKANAVINLMGTAGGIVILAFGILFATGKWQNALMTYQWFFAAVSGVMLVSLVVFMIFVKEPKLVKEMQEESRRFGIDESGDEAETTGEKRRLSKEERRSLILIMASVMLWFMGYNAVTSKYSVYAGSVLALDYNTTLTIAMGAAVVAYLPVGIIASKVGRKKTILAGIIILGCAFTAAAFMKAGSSLMVMNIFFALAGIGWATINVNSFPMVVELASGSDVGKYTGFYYTASMLAQTMTPYLSGKLMDVAGMRTLFPYGAVFVFLSFVTMLFVKHGDSRPTAVKDLEAFDVDVDM